MYEDTAGDEVEDLACLLAYVKKRHPEVDAVSSGAIASGEGARPGRCQAVASLAAAPARALACCSPAVPLTGKRAGPWLLDATGGPLCMLSCCRTIGVTSRNPPACRLPAHARGASVLPSGPHLPRLPLAPASGRGRAARACGPLKCANVPQPGRQAERPPRLTLGGGHTLGVLASCRRRCCDA